jgi:hypothetical protein
MKTPTPMDTTDDPGDGAAGRARLRRTAIRVLIVQVITLALLWQLQAIYG